MVDNPVARPDFWGGTFGGGGVGWPGIKLHWSVRILSWIHPFSNFHGSVENHRRCKETNIRDTPPKTNMEPKNDGF